MMTTSGEVYARDDLGVRAGKEKPGASGTEQLAPTNNRRLTYHSKLGDYLTRSTLRKTTEGGLSESCWLCVLMS